MTAAEPTAVSPWTVTLAWTPGQNFGRVSVMPRRSPVFAILGRVRAGEPVSEVADDYDVTVEEVQVLRHLADDIRRTRLPQPRQRRQATAVPGDLTDGELHVLRGMAMGQSNREIGDRLGLAVDTIKSRNRNLFHKLDAQGRAHAVHRGHVLGLLDARLTPQTGLGEAS